MSLDFRLKFGEDEVTKEQMREWNKRPPLEVDENGKGITLTEQHHKKECDINNIIKKYDKTGLITHISRIEAKFGNVSGIDFGESMRMVAEAKTLFATLPSDIRNRFKNSPKELLEFMDKPENREEAIRLGLIRKDWTEETDGLGEHVKEGENIKTGDIVN